MTEPIRAPFCSYRVPESRVETGTASLSSVEDPKAARSRPFTLKRMRIHLMNPSNSLAAACLLLFLATSSCIDADRPATVEARYPALKAVEHLTDPRRVALWMVPFSDTDTSRLEFLPNGFALEGDTVTISPEGPVDITYRRSDGRSESSFTIVIEPLVDKPKTTRFRQTFKKRGSDSQTKDARESLKRLPAYLDNPSRIYGYDIREITVTDSVFLFSSKRIQRERFGDESRDLFDRLIASAERLGVAYNGVRIFHYDDSEPGGRAIYAGIGIDRPVETAPGDDVKCKRMPFGHHLLAVDYDGPYHGLPRILEALDQYRADNGKASMAIPFHKYLQEGYGFTDSQTVKMRVCFPVY